jgi:hypothetical protein
MVFVGDTIWSRIVWLITGLVFGPFAWGAVVQQIVGTKDIDLNKRAAYPALVWLIGVVVGTLLYYRIF